MFGFTIGKLFVLVLLLLVAWYGLRYVGLLDAARKTIRPGVSVSLTLSWGVHMVRRTKGRAAVAIQRSTDYGAAG